MGSGRPARIREAREEETLAPSPLDDGEAAEQIDDAPPV